MPRAILPAVLLTLAAALHAAGAPSSGASAPWSWPLPVPREIVRGYLAPPTPYASGHRGLDLLSTPGAPVAAVAAGVVHFAGPVGGRPVVSVRHDDGTLSSLEPVRPLVVEGQRIARGEVIGAVATDAAHCAGCVHLGARIDGAYVSPLLLLGGLERAVLLPP